MLLTGILNGSKKEHRIVIQPESKCNRDGTLGELVEDEFVVAAVEKWLEITEGAATHIFGKYKYYVSAS